MPSFRETFPTELPPLTADVYRVCEWFQVRDVTGATQQAISALLLPGRDGIASDLRTARDILNRRLQVLDELSTDGRQSLIGDWTDAHEQQLDIAARQADESQLPEGLAWSAAPSWASGLVSNSTDVTDERQLVWVPALVGEVFGMNAHDFRHMKRGSGQSCSLSHEHSQWLIVATRPPGAVLDRLEGNRLIVDQITKRCNK